MRFSISASSDRLLVTVELRKVKRSVTSSTSMLMLVEGSAGKSWPMTLVFLMLIISLNSSRITYYVA